MAPGGMVLKAETGDALYDVRRPEKQENMSASHALKYQRDVDKTYKRESTISASVDLWFIKIDKDPWMPQRSPSAVAGDNSFLRPSHWLLVD